MSRLSRLWGQPSAVLLVAQLGSVVLFPFMEGPVGRAALSTVGLAILFLAVRAVRATPALTWIAVVLGLPLIGLTIWEVVDPANSAVVFLSSILHAAFYFYTSAALVRYLFHDRFVTLDELWATAATFTVVAWAFAYVYAATQLVWPDSFTAAIDAGDPRGWVDLLFLSVTTLTSTGLSDIVPVRPHARSFVMIEQIAGMLYLAMVVARITALTVARSSHR
jgi:hypothetical protein